MRLIVAAVTGLLTCPALVVGNSFMALMGSMPPTVPASSPGTEARGVEAFPEFQCDRPTSFEDERGLFRQDPRMCSLNDPFKL